MNVFTIADGRKSGYQGFVVLANENEVLWDGAKAVCTGIACFLNEVVENEQSYRNLAAVIAKARGENLLRAKPKLLEDPEDRAIACLLLAGISSVSGSRSASEALDFARSLLAATEASLITLPEAAE